MLPRHHPFFLLLWILSTSVAITPVEKAPDYTLVQDAMAAAGGAAYSATYSLVASSLAEPVTVGIAKNSQYSVWSGFSPATHPAYTGVEDQQTPTPPAVTELFPPSPNPFNPRTRLQYSLSEPAHVSLHIYSVAGQLVRSIELGKKAAGHFHYDWNGTNNSAKPLGSGLYFAILNAGNVRSTQRLVLIR